jgi:hypothetical protein
MRANRGLRELVLRKNALGDAGFGALCSALSANTTLRRLDVAFNHITDASVPALVALVAGPARASALASIDLTGNLMTAAGMAQARVCEYIIFPFATRTPCLGPPSMFAHPHGFGFVDGATSF